MPDISRDEIIRLYKTVLETRNDYKAVDDLDIKVACTKGWGNMQKTIAATRTGHWNAFNRVLTIMADMFGITYEELEGGATMDLKTQLKEAAIALSDAIDKFNMVSTPDEQDALWHEIEATKARISAIVKQAKEAQMA